MFCVSKANCHGNTEDHEHPIDLRDVDLSVYPVGCVDDLHSRKTTKGLDLVDNREGPTYDRLTPDNGSQDC